jgi:hypothetical protein
MRLGQSQLLAQIPYLKQIIQRHEPIVRIIVCELTEQ